MKTHHRLLPTLVQYTCRNAAENTSYRTRPFPKSCEEDRGADRKCNALAVLILKRKKNALALVTVEAPATDHALLLSSGSKDGLGPRERYTGRVGKRRLEHTFFSYNRGNTVAAARGATNSANSCLFRACSTNTLHPHMRHPAPTQRPESHINGVTVF
jgi:hypothetical protein